MTVDVAAPGDPGYEVGRANTLVREKPAGVVTAKSATDVQEAVRFAATRGLPLAVQATGHATTVPADGALLVSTREMTGIAVDAAARTARVEAGVRAESLIAATAAHGLAPVNGAAITVGTVGFTLGGGLGPLSREFGLAVDHVRELEIVTADGSLHTVLPGDDLFWAARGSRGNFGVVTALVTDLVPVTRLYGGGLFFGADSTATVLELYREWVESVPDSMGTSVCLLRLPPFEAIPEPIRGKFVLHVRIAYTGTASDGEALVRPLREAAPTLLDSVEEMPYTAVGTIHNDPVEPAPFVEKSALLRALEPETIKVLLDLAGPDANPPVSLVELRHLGGAIARPPARPSAVGFRDAAYSVFAGTVGVPELVEPAHEFQAQLVDALSPWRKGGPFVCFLSGKDTDPAIVATAYEEADYQRLRELKSTYDPTNLFRVNHNIPPF